MGADGRVAYTPAHAYVFLSCCPLAFGSSFFGDNAELLSYTALVSSFVTTALISIMRAAFSQFAFHSLLWYHLSHPTAEIRVSKCPNQRTANEGNFRRCFRWKVFKLLDLYWIFLHPLLFPDVPHLWTVWPVSALISSANLINIMILLLPSVEKLVPICCAVKAFSII